MIKRIAKRALSVILTLVLIATTFFIFDPSVLKIDSEAYVNTEANAASKTLSSQEAYAPETIYLKPGSDAFNYFCNYNSGTGAAGESKATSSYLYFKNLDATEVTLAVNRVYYKNGSTDTNHTGTLKVNSTTVSTYAGCSATSTNFVNSATAVANGTNTINYTVSTGSLSGCAQNTTYFIEWVVRYKIDGTYHLMFMYTGVYCPSLNMTAVATKSRYTGTGNTPEMSSFALVTGAMKYSEKGNRYHAFTGNTLKYWGGTTGSGTRTAPLVGFMGYKNSSTANTIPNEDYNSTNNFPTSSTGSGKTVLVTGGSVNGEYPTYYTNFTSYGTYANPNPTGTISGDCNASGYQTGVAYIVVDTSRYSNYNQIPYLQAGFVTTYKKSGGAESFLSWIQGKPTNDVRDGNLGVSIYCSNDTGDHDEDGTNSRTYGLYQINGPIYNGGFQLAFHYRHGVSFGVGTRTFKQTTAIGIHTTTVSKENLRLTYNKALHTNIDLVNVNASKTALSSMNYSSYYSQLKTTGEALCDPTSYSMTQNSTLDEYATTWDKAISNALDTAVYFYVPEVIYLNPVANSSSQYIFQYYVDRGNSANSTLIAEGARTVGNVYFKSTSASRVVSISGSISGGNVTVGTSSSSGNEISTTMSGYSTTYADKMITWTCKYIDKGSGKEMTTTAYTRCVAMPKATAGSTVISASAQAGYDSKWHDDTNIGVTGWIVGATSADARAYTITSASAGTADNGSVGDGRGGYKNNYLEAPSTVPTNGSDNISNLYNESYNGGSGYYASDGDVNWTTGGKGTIYIDSSRYTNLGQIPQLYVGIDVNNKYVQSGHNKSADIALYYDWYSNGSNKSPTTYTAASQTGVSTGNAQRGVKLSSATFTAKTTTTNTLVLHPWSKSYGDDNRVAQASCYLVCQFRDKTILREAYELMMKNSTSLQQAYFTDSAWSTFTSYRNYIYNYLLNPNSTESQANLETYGKNLYNQVSKMVACVKADAGSTTASYTTYDKTTATVNRSDVLKTGTARVYHRYINGGSGSSTTTAALNAAVDGTTNVETKTYYYGETVSTGYNDTKGYSYFGYFRNEGTTQWTSPANGDLIANAPGPNKYGSSGDNSDILVAVPNLTYTYVYHKQDLSVCKDYGDSIQNLGAVQNLANLSSASFNASYGDWGASGGTATVSGTSATGFSFSVTKVGASGERYFNDIYITNAATGLTAGGTYTIAFKSDLDYDDMAWYGNEFNSASGWKQNNDYRYTPGSMALYVLTTSQGTKALQKVDTSYSTGGTVASFTLPSGTTAVNLVLRIFSDGTEMYDGTITDFKIAEGQYVYEGVEGDSVTFDTPTRIGYTFQGWIEESSPFDGTLSGTLNTTYTFGCGNDVVLANWKANTYIVTFDPNSGTCSLANKPVIFDDEYGALPQPEKTGYTYTGWYTAKDGGERIVTTTIVKTPNDHTLYAQWKANTYAVYFNANGGTCSTPSKIVTYDATYGDLPVPSRTGYTFDGWFTAASGGDEVTASTVVKITGQQILYAHWTANTYTVTFNANGGSCGTANKVVTFDSAYGDLPDCTRTGYAFAGWYTAETSGTKVEASTVVKTARDHTLYAHWSANTYTVYFDANTGVCDTASKTVTYDSAYGALPTPTKTGYSFNGWFTATSGGSKVDKTTVVKTVGDHTLYAQWTANSYKVTFNANGGTVSPASKTVTFDSTYGDLPTPARTGYTFNGWFTATSGGTRVVSSTAVKTASDHTIYAQWTANNYTVTFDATGGSVSPASKAVTFDSTYGELPIPTREGYTFAGWYTAASGGTRIFADTVVSTAKDHTLYAHWTANTYTVTFNANAGSCATPSKTVTFDSPYGELPTPVRTGYTSEGWYTAELDGELVKATTTVKTASDHTLYAHWAANKYTVTFDPNGGKCTPTSKKVTYYEAYGELPTATRDGYTFDGWFTAKDGGEKIEPTTIYTLSDVQTLYAHWTVNDYTVTFDPTGGECGTVSKVVTFDAEYGALPTASRTGYAFEAWYTAKNGGTLIEESTVVETASDHTLYAHWIANKYTVTLDANSGDCETPAIIVNFGSPYGALPTATKSCYTFVGWYTQAEGGDLVTQSTIVNTLSDHTIYAHWVLSGHDYVDEVFEPTCLEDGYTVHTCSRCGDTYTDSIIPKGPDYHSWIYVSSDSTTHTYECEICHERKTEEHKEDMDGNCICDDGYKDGAYEVDIVFGGKVICFKYMPITEMFDSSNFSVPVKYRASEYRVGHDTVLTPRADYQNPKNGDVITYDANFEYTDYAGGRFDVTVVDKGVTTVTSYGWEQKATIRSSWANFLYWVDEYGNIVSTYKVYYFLTVKDTTLTAVYKSDVSDPSAEKAFIKTNFAENGDDDSLTFYSERCVNYSNYTLLSHGMILAPSSKVGNDYNTLYNSLVCGSGNSSLLVYDKAVPEGQSTAKCYGMFTVAVPQKYLAAHSLDNEVWYARAYVLVENKTTGEIEYHYGDIAEFDLSDPNATFTRRTDVKNDNLLIAAI